MSDTETMPRRPDREPSPAVVVDDRLADQLLARAEAEGVELLGPEGLLSQVTRAVLERALGEELAVHLGYDKHDPAGRGSGNTPQREHPEAGCSPRSARSSWPSLGTATAASTRRSPRLGQTRLDGFNDRIIALYGRGLTTRDIAAHLREMYDVDVSPDLISRVTDAVVDELTEWQSRPLDPVYPVIFIDALMVKIRDGVVGNRPVYLAVGIDTDGVKQVLGMWVGPTTGESAKFWLTVLAELRNRGIGDVCIVCCDGLTGLPDAVTVVWPRATVQLCVVHLIRASLRYASKKDWTPLTQCLRPIYTAVDETAAAAALDALEVRWGTRYPAIVRLWRGRWEQFVPFLAFPQEVRRVIYTTNLIESMNARLRKATRNRGQFPSEQAVGEGPLPRSPEPAGLRRPTVGIRSSGWKQALQAFTIYFEGRLSTE